MEDPDQIMSAVCVCHQQNMSVQYTSSYVSLRFCRFTDVKSLDATESNKSSTREKKHTSRQSIFFYHKGALCIIKSRDNKEFLKIMILFK